MNYYNLLAMIYTVWIMNETDTQNMHETQW